MTRTPACSKARGQVHGVLGVETPRSPHRVLPSCAHRLLAAALRVGVKEDTPRGPSSAGLVSAER